MPSRKRVKVQVNKSLIGPSAPRPVTIVPRSADDFPQSSLAHRALAEKLSSPLYLGPPICDEFMALLEHVFSEDEAELVRHLTVLKGTSAKAVAKKAHQDENSVRRVLDAAAERRCIWHEGDGDARRYKALPLMPGLFEILMCGHELETMNPWVRRFAELFADLYDTGYYTAYVAYRTDTVRYMPTGHLAKSHPLALPSDQFEQIIDSYNSFAVGHCQCRMSAEIVGKGCGKPTLNCSALGEWADGAISRGLMKRVSKKEYIEIKKEAEAAGLVNFLMNIDFAEGQASCSCCGCCCYVLRLISDFDMPAAIAKPHFQPVINKQACTNCGACARVCPTGAIVVDPKRSTWTLPHRCIGCGLCAAACKTKDAIRMDPLPDYRIPPDSWFGFARRTALGTGRNLLRGWLKTRQV